MAITETNIILRADDRTRAAFASAQRGMDQLQTKAKSLGTAMASIGVGLSVAGIGAFVKSSIDAADALQDLSDRVGVSVKDLASFKLAAQLADTDLQSLGDGIARLSRTIGDADRGNKTAAKALQELGISARDPKEAFLQLADAVKRIEDPNRRAALLNNVLGKSYQELLPLLQQGGDALRKSAEESESYADSMARLAPEAGKFNDALDKLKLTSERLAATLAGPAVKSLNEYGAALLDVLETGTLLDKVKAFGFGYFSPEVMDRIREAGERVQDYNVEIFKLQQQLLEFRRVENSSSPNISAWERKIAALEKTRSELIARARSDAARAANANAAGIDVAPAAPAASASRTRTAADPLASLLGQTDTAKLAEFEKLQALLDARFQKNTISGKQYAEALTVLRERYFSDELKEYRDQLDYVAETEREMAEHLRETENQLNAQRNAITEAGRALEEEMRTPLEAANIELGRLQWLLDEGAISFETFARATFKVQEGLDGVNKNVDEMDSFAKKFAENAQDSIADFFKNFDKGTDGMLKKFGETMKALVAEAVAADLSRWLFGDLVKDGKGSGAFRTVLSGIGSIFGLADGGIMTSAGPVPLNRYATGGIASSPQLALFGEGRTPEAFVPLPDGRNIPVKMQGGGGHTFITNVYGANNAPDLRRAAGQGMREAVALMRGAQRYV